MFLKHPDPAAIRRAMDKLEATHSRHETVARLDIGEPYIHHEDDCGTTACVGGWYALATMEERGTGKWETRTVHCGTDSDGTDHYCEISEFVRGGTPVSFEVGAEAMARDMGAHHSDALATWASQEPEVWGNSFGGHMFRPTLDNRLPQTAAYVPEGSGEYAEADLADVIAWWRGVADRIEAIEREGE